MKEKFSSLFWVLFLLVVLIFLINADCFNPVPSLFGGQSCSSSLSGQVDDFKKDYAANASISLTKNANRLNFKQPGDVLSYTYVLTNTGERPFFGGWKVTDDKVSVTCDSAPIFSAKQSVNCYGSYTVTDADMAAGQVVNTASAQASHTNEYFCSDLSATYTYTATAAASATVKLDANPALTLAKSANPATYSGGQRVTYLYTLTNSGDVTLSGPFTIADNRISLVQCPQIAQLAPGASLQCTATYLIDAGLRWTITNTATGYGSFFGKQVISNTVSVGVQFVQPTDIPRRIRPAYCGDGIVTPPEQCDPPDNFRCSETCQWMDA